MRVTITGATGRIGTRLVAELQRRGDEVTVLSRSPGKAAAALGVEAAAWQPEAEAAPAAAPARPGRGGGGGAARVRGSPCRGAGRPRRGHPPRGRGRRTALERRDQATPAL